MKRAREDKTEMNFLIVGDTCTGKTELIEALKNPHKECANPATPLGLSTVLRVEPIQLVSWDFESQPQDVQIWNTANQESSQTLLASSYSKADVIGLIFDMTSKASLDSLHVGDGKCGRRRSWKAHVHLSSRGFNNFVLIGFNHDQWQLDCEAGTNTKGVLVQQIWEAAEALGVRAVVAASHRTMLNVQDLRTTLLRLGLNHSAGVNNAAWTRPNGDNLPDWVLPGAGGTGADGEESSVERRPSTITDDGTLAPPKRHPVRSDDEGCCVLS